jgi:uncharacterized protein YecE (DUF72 family)
MNTCLVGTAGWSVDRRSDRFPTLGTALERYAAVFAAAEVNSSFHRRHRPATWQRWHDAVPPHFKFSIKLPKTITHDRRLVGAKAELDTFQADVQPLGRKIGALLIQLPPKLAFDAGAAAEFFLHLRQRFDMPVFIEPRHPSWANPVASSLLRENGVGRVYADPQDPSLQEAARTEPSRYLRLHGSPKIYYSAYSNEQLVTFSALLRAAEGPSWCIFDNTASSAAPQDALKMLDLLA